MDTVLSYAVNKAISDPGLTIDQKIDIIETCIANGFGINQNDSGILFSVLLTANLELTRCLIRNNINLQSQNNLALVHATNDNEVFELLIKSGCDPKIRSAEILESAIDYSRLDVIKIFMKYNNDYVINNLNMLFHIACKKSNYTIAKFIMELDISKIDLTYFQYNLFALSGYIQFKSILLKNGLNANMSIDGLQLLEIAFINSDLSTCVMLLSHNADINLCRHFATEKSITFMKTIYEIEQLARLLKQNDSDIGLKFKSGK